MRYTHEDKTYTLRDDLIPKAFELLQGFALIHDEALVLVVIVTYLFLQNWRATLIPAIAVPVALVGTFGPMALLGFSFNTLSLLGLVLAGGHRGDVAGHRSLLRLGVLPGDSRLPPKGTGSRR